jgi:NADPH:quinone reductase-like Zn-dependent oxidoreductase
MRAAAFTSPGGPDVLRVLDLPDPTPAAGQVLIRIRAAGVQPYDCAVRAGWLPAGVPPTFPRIPGNEFAGVVAALGPGVSGVAVGAEVLGFGQLGAYAELLAVPADQVVAKPPAMPWEVAGGFSAGAQTAHIALTELAPEPGETLLVHGAAGAVGTVAVQLAVAAGATVDELGVRVAPALRSAARLAALVELHQRAKLRIHVRRSYDLSAAADAHREVETGHGRGKVVITI